MKSSSVYLVLLFAATTIFAVEFEVRATMYCQDCDFCHSVANVQLWEEDSTDPDDLIDETVVKERMFGLKFNQSELLGVTPYLLIRDDCSRRLWNKRSGRKREGKEFCFVQTRHNFTAPDGGKPPLRVEFNVNLESEDYNLMDICVSEAEFHRIFNGSSLRGGTTYTVKPQIYRGEEPR